jgi:hypothetical protein
MGKGCNKKSSNKNREVAEATTRANKIRKYTRICKQHPNNHVAFNTLNQLLHDSGIAV